MSKEQTALVKDIEVGTRVDENGIRNAFSPMMAKSIGKVLSFAVLARKNWYKDYHGYYYHSSWLDFDYNKKPEVKETPLDSSVLNRIKKLSNG